MLGSPPAAQSSSRLAAQRAVTWASPVAANFDQPPREALPRTISPSADPMKTQPSAVADTAVRFDARPTSTSVQESASPGCTTPCNTVPPEPTAHISPGLTDEMSER